MSSVLRKIRPRTFRARLVLWYTAVFALTAAALFVLGYVLIVNQLRREMEQMVVETHEEYVKTARSLLPDVARLHDELAGHLGYAHLCLPYCRLIDASSGSALAVLPKAAPDIPLAPEILQRAAGGQATMEQVIPRGRRSTRYMIYTTRLEVAGRRYILQSGREARRFQKRQWRLRRYLLYAMPGIVALAVVGGLFLAGRGVRPMAEIVRRLNEIRAVSLSRRLPDREANDELGLLTHAINNMLEELEQSFGRSRSFTSDAAHELRTPLATLICQLEVALSRKRPAGEYRAELNAVLERAKDLSHLVDDLLFFARTDEAASLPDRRAVDLAPVLADLADSFQLVAEQKGVGLSLDAGPPLPVWGNAQWLRTLFANLIDNAVKYTPGGGTIAISASRRGNAVSVVVEDSGIGIEPEDRERIFDRFYRTDGSRSRDTGGTGLGLSLAKRVVDLHDGQIHATARPGGGSRFEVILPCGSPGA